MIPYLCPQTFPFAQVTYKPEASESQAPVHPEQKAQTRSAATQVALFRFNCRNGGTTHPAYHVVRLRTPDHLTLHNATE